ncbi:hypothetical protein [Paraburkholderia caffeinilytica]|uniref:Lipoprotein n=1 Tax=Paraburkholderia caffeinilytica TaxID=1761016 RepID=A0ABQ1NBH6_9BURK|nr:hypothetical protein [Paraburkholderia caffeinilytica]GGC66208.1 hypothetical protein GCM10011400_62740 [Paraburkholderia caffeinilytica]CAB3803833.1 hypothetical protein LMG28690_05886 [Paraburkholderia caffeinilytica]
MKSFCSTAALAALIVLAAGCSSTWPPASKQTVQPVPADTDRCMPCANHGATRADSASRQPVLSVGVSDPDTQLNLPWFLADLINAVNAHESVGDLLHTIGRGF